MTQSKADLLAIADAVRKDAGVESFIPLPNREMEEAYSSPFQKSVVAPIGDTAKGLTILAHECGHVATTAAYLDAHPNLTGKTDVEFEATRWGFEHIRQHGGQTTPAMERSARMALRDYIVGDLMEGASRPSDAAMAFANGATDL